MLSPILTCRIRTIADEETIVRSAVSDKAFPQERTIANLDSLIKGTSFTAGNGNKRTDDMHQFGAFCVIIAPKWYYVNMNVGNNLKKLRKIVDTWI